MEQSAELELCERIAAVRSRIRERVCRTGMAGRWHLGKATDIATGKLEFSHHVALPDEDEPAYRAGLPELIELSRLQDEQCRLLWEARSYPEHSAVYDRERRELVALFLRFQFRLRMYERVVRQPQKPILDQAKSLLASGRGTGPAAAKLEAMLRLTLADYVALEEAVARDLRQLDEDRVELVAGHRDLIAAIAEGNPEAELYASCGLEKAAEHYEYRHGFRFATYAWFWVETAIREKKTWGLRPNGD